jgi:hypothetical protein
MTCSAKSLQIAGRPAVTLPGRPTGRPALSLPSRPLTCLRRAGHLTCSQSAGQQPAHIEQVNNLLT